MKIAEVIRGRIRSNSEFNYLNVSDLAFVSVSIFHKITSTGLSHKFLGKSTGLVIDKLLATRLRRLANKPLSTHFKHFSFVQFMF